MQDRLQSLPPSKGLIELVVPESASEEEYGLKDAVVGDASMAPGTTDFIVTHESLEAHFPELPKLLPLKAMQPASIS